MSEPMPTLADVRNAYSVFVSERTDDDHQSHARAFHRFIESIRANAWDEGAHRVHASSLDESEWTTQDWMTENPYRKDIA